MLQKILRYSRSFLLTLFGLLFFRHIPKKLIRYICYTLLTVFGILLLLVMMLYSFQDRIIRTVVESINEQLNGKLTVQQVSVSAFRHFPNASIAFSHLTLYESFKKKADTLGYVQTAYFTFSLWDVIGGNYHIKQLYFSDGSLHLKVDAAGKSNFDIFRENKKTATAPVDFNLRNIRMSRVKVRFQNRQHQQFCHLSLQEIRAAFANSDAELSGEVEGGILVSQVSSGQQLLKEDQHVGLDTKFVFIKKEKRFILFPSNLDIGGLNLTGKGEYDGSRRSLIQLELEGNAVSLKELIDLIPSENEYLKKMDMHYQKGGIHFQMNLSGRLSKDSIPSIRIRTVANGISFMDYDATKRVEDLGIELIYNNGTHPGSQPRRRVQHQLEIRKLQGRINAHRFSFTGFYTSEFFTGDCNVDANLSDLNAFMPLLGEMSGRAELVCSVRVQIEKLQKEGLSNENVYSKGTLNLKDVSLTLPERRLKQLNGTFDFDFNEVKISDLVGKVGTSDFRIAGKLTNLIPAFFFKNYKPSAEISLSSALIDLEEFIPFAESNGNKEDSIAKSGFPLSDLSVNFSAEVQEIRFKKFSGKNLKGKLSLKDRVLQTSGVSVETAGGSVKIAGMADAKDGNAIKISADVSLHDINTVQVMQMTDNFGQNFISDKNLQGQVSATVQLITVLNGQHSLDLAKTSANVELLIRNGRLMNFEPLQKLSGFMKNRNLADVSFSELKNTFYIDSQKITIPRMEIASGVGSLFAEGAHHFDGTMDYHLQIPLRNLQAPDVSVGAENRSGANVFIKISGSSNQMKVGLDQQAIHRKMSEDLQKEKEEFKGLFKKKKQKQYERLGNERFD